MYLLGVLPTGLPCLVIIAGIVTGHEAKKYERNKFFFNRLKQTNTILSFLFLVKVSQTFGQILE